MVNIPRGQFLRIKRNRTSISNYEEQSSQLASKFIMKGYDQEFINKKRQEVGSMERDILLANKPVEQSNELPLALIMDYNLQYKHVKRIIEKYCNVLKHDDILKSLIPEKPRFIYSPVTVGWPQVTLKKELSSLIATMVRNIH